MFEEYNNLLSIEDMCSMLYIGKNVAYDLLRTKQIKAFLIGNSWKIPKKAIEGYVRQKAKL